MSCHISSQCLGLVMELSIIQRSPRSPQEKSMNLQDLQINDIERPQPRLYSSQTTLHRLLFREILGDVHGRKSIICIYTI